MSTPKGKKKGKRNSKSANSSKGRFVPMQSKQATRKVVAAPAIAGQVARNNFNFAEKGRVFDRQTGLDGVVVHGSQKLANVQVTSSACFASGTYSPALTGSNAIFLDPNSLAQSLGLYADIYRRYRFRYMRIRYSTSIATSTANNFVIGICGDPGNNTGWDYDSTTTMEPAVEFPGWIPEASLEYRFRGQQLWYTYQAADSGTTADERLECQGRLYMFCTNTAFTDLRFGTLYLDYEIEFYDRGHKFQSSLALSAAQLSRAKHILLEEKRNEKALERKVRPKPVTLTDDECPPSTISESAQQQPAGQIVTFQVTSVKSACPK